MLDSTGVPPENQRHPPASTHRAAFSTDSARSRRDRAIEEAGGEEFLAAAAALDGLPGAIRPNSRAAVQLNREVRAAESAALRLHAVSVGLLLDGADFERRWREQGEMGGSENDLWYDETTGLVWKRNRIDVLHLSYRQFFERMLLHNAYFPESPVRLRGFVDTPTGIAPVFTQPDVWAECGAPRGVVEPMMAARGYRRVASEDYQSATLHVEDLHLGNALVDADGKLHVIDPVIFVVGRENR